jgi:hypothetical protein
MDKMFYIGRYRERRRKKEAKKEKEFGEEGRKGEINEWIQHLYQTT